MPLLEFTDAGIFCAQAGVWLDPWRPVAKALVTHGHSDHASGGHGAYLCTGITASILKHRLHLHENVQSVAYGNPISVNGVRFSFHPAGHIPGSAQIRVEHRGEVWVFSGDYKLQKDGISAPFEPVKCHTFITESTFGLPVYRWDDPEIVAMEINDWWQKNRSDGKTSVIAGYTLGKAQRVLHKLDTSIAKVFVHGAVSTMNDVIRKEGISLPDTIYVNAQMKKKDWEGGLVICPPSAIASPWIRKFMPYSLAIASGWMKLRGARRRRGADRGFVVSDHADWNDLNRVVKETEATRVMVTHGYTEVFARWLRDQGLDAHEVKTAFEGELEEIS